MVDSTMGRAQVSAAGAKAGGAYQLLARARGGFTCKVHGLGEARGLPLAFHLTPGAAADGRSFEHLVALAQVKPVGRLADQSYDTDTLRAKLKTDGISPVIAPNTHRKTLIRWKRRMCRERNRIERLLGHRKLSRALATLYDQLARSFRATRYIAAMRKCLRTATL